MKKTLLFLTIFILNGNVGYTHSYFTEHFQQLKTNTISHFLALSTTQRQQASINPLEKALGFNVFVEEGISTVNGDIEGTAALGGDLNLIGTLTLAGNDEGSFRISGDTSNTGLVVGGQIIYTSGGGINVNRNTYIKLGNATGSNIYDMQGGVDVVTRIAAGDYNSNPKVSLQVHQPTSSVTQTNVIDFSASFQDFRSYSTAISQYPATIAIGNNAGTGVIVLNPNQVNVWNVTASGQL